MAKVAVGCRPNPDQNRTYLAVEAVMPRSVEENGRLRIEVKEHLRRTVIRLIEKCQTSDTVRRALCEAAKIHDISDTQLVRVGKIVGLSAAQILELAAEVEDGEDEGDEQS